VAAAGLGCTITEAAYIGTSAATVNGAAVTRNAYEVAAAKASGTSSCSPSPRHGGAEAVDCLWSTPT
jgi:carbonic anhydrase/acetyltransferase-like protein (isoleucine patch superfamily)